MTDIVDDLTDVAAALAPFSYVHAYEPQGTSPETYISRRVQLGPALGTCKIARYTGSGQAQVDIDLNAGVDLSVKPLRYDIHGWITAATDGINLLGRFTLDGFSTIESGATDYMWFDLRWNEVVADVASGSLANDSSDASMRFCTNIGNAAGEAFMGSLRVSAPEVSALPTLVRAENDRINSSGNLNGGFAVGRDTAARAVNGLRLFASSGNISYDLSVQAIF